MNREQTVYREGLPIDPEVKACDDIYDSIIRSIKRQEGYMVDYPVLRKAYETAKRLHAGVRRHSGILYLHHPLAVMESLSRLKCKTSILAAALLHDTMEDCDYTYEDLRSDFKDEIGGIVSAVTAIKEVEKEAEASFASLTESERHDVLDQLTDAKLIKSRYQREAFLVRFADREHNLATIDACKPEKRRLKIEQTKAFLIPAAQILGMRYYVTMLNNYCMKFAEDSTPYDTLLGLRRQYVSVSKYAYTEFDKLLKASLEVMGKNDVKEGKKPLFALPPFNPFARLRGAGQDGPQLECRRQLNPYELMCQLDGDIFFARQDVCMNEVILTYDDEDKSRIFSAFIKFFSQTMQRKTMLRAYLEEKSARERDLSQKGKDSEEALRQLDAEYQLKAVTFEELEALLSKPMFLEYVGEDDLSLTLKLTDNYENDYRVVIVRRQDLETYFIGDPEGTPLTLVDERSIADALRPKITVYSYTDRKGLRKFEGIVPQGATALDFAFFINPALAYTVEGAKIKKKTGETVTFSEEDHPYPHQTILEDGDVVHFLTRYVFDPESSADPIQAPPQVKIDWFGYVNTELARNKLIDYYRPILTSREPG